MRQELKLLLPMALALAMAGTVAYKSLKISKQAKAQPSFPASPGIVSTNAKQSCREVIQKALALGWEDSHRDLAKALEIGRERLPQAQRVYEKSCEAEVTR